VAEDEFPRRPLLLREMWEGGATMSSEDFQGLAEEIANVNQTLKQIVLYLRLLSGAKE